MYLKTRYTGTVRLLLNVDILSMMIPRVTVGISTILSLYWEKFPFLKAAFGVGGKARYLSVPPSCRGAKEGVYHTLATLDSHLNHYTTSEARIL